jgi:penicillin-binding protein 1A
MQEQPTPIAIVSEPAYDEPDSRPSPGAPAPPKPKLKKLRLAFVLLGLSLLALVSTVFGMMMAVASDLPALENQAEYRAAKNSVLLADVKGNPEIARLTGNRNRILVEESEISPNIKNAVIAIEDERFYEHKGVDYQGIARALFQDILSRSAQQGGSTITQQFVKNALEAQGNRSVFQKLREAALAYHLEREWTKQKVLKQYLNSVYFGNGAYGVEAAVRTYFGEAHGFGDEDSSTAPGAEGTAAGAGNSGRAKRYASLVEPHEAALLAGLIASPTLYDPIEHPRRSKERRDAVLESMLEQGSITEGEYRESVAQVLPTKSEINPPSPDSDQPYFSSWLTQQLVDRYGPGVVFGGGLKIKTTIDPELQKSAEEAIAGRLTGVGPDASLVAIENKTGEVKAMVGGMDFDSAPFNLATNGHRQPGSSFKPFTLMAALESGVSPEQTFTSQQKVFPVPGSKTEKFVVHNYEDQYSGIASLRSATAQSDNSVYAELGLKVGTRKIARVARRMGVRTPISTNPAMTLGGLKQGLTPLELAYAYSTIANKGERVSGSLAASKNGPVAIEEVSGGGRDDKNEKRTTRAFSPEAGETAQQLLAGVVLGGTGKAAQIGEFAAGKTGTTENYGDAWFIGFNKELTVAVWVGYAKKLTPMKTEHHGGPVAGGTFPAEIWHDLMTSWISIRERREDESGKQDDEEDQNLPTAPLAPAPSEGPSTTPAEPTDQPKKEPGAEPKPPSRPRQPAQQQPAPAPAPPPAPTPSPGGTGGAGGGAAPD